LYGTPEREFNGIVKDAGSARKTESSQRIDACYGPVMAFRLELVIATREKNVLLFEYTGEDHG